jgi:branched-chain amino acid transport system ATP-binding protein
MDKAVRILREEHRSIAAVLSGLKSLAQMAQNAQLQPDFQVFHAMIHYIDAFPERMHHPKEDEHLFARLLERRPEARALIEALKVEHVQGAQLVRELEQALLEFERTWPQGADRFAATVENYSQFHWRHMSREENEVLPLAQQALSAEDWRAIEAAFAGNDDPIADLREQDFEAIYKRILNLAPAPIGLGERWKKAP